MLKFCKKILGIDFDIQDEIDKICVPIKPDVKPEFSCVAKTILKDLENENPLDWKFEKKYVFYNGDSKIKYFLVWEEKYIVLINDLDFNTLTKKEQRHICNKLLEIWIFQKEVKTTKLFPNCT